jgi:hypothetical protein
MKFLETHFEEYFNSVNKINLHPELQQIYNLLPDNINNLCNLIFYGPSGVGKYSQMLYAIKKYSPSQLKYEKKIIIQGEKKQYYVKISDIHYEIDMSLLGCNSKNIWHDIYIQLVDVLSTKQNKTGIIVCKEFHNTYNELLEIFYNYMQENNHSMINIKFILLTEQLSFIPNDILNCCEIIHIKRPSKQMYNSILENSDNNSNILNDDFNINIISNIKDLHIKNYNLMIPHKIICNKIINDMLNIEQIKFLKFRDLLYDIFIYNLNINDCIWYIIHHLIINNNINSSNFSQILIKTYSFLRYYNNNYRPIYHLESYLFYLITIIHGYKNEC